MSEVDPERMKILIERIKESLAGEMHELPPGLTREEKREAILAVAAQYNQTGEVH